MRSGHLACTRMHISFCFLNGMHFLLLFALNEKRMLTLIGSCLQHNFSMCMHLSQVNNWRTAKRWKKEMNVGEGRRFFFYSCCVLEVNELRVEILITIL